MSFLTMSPGMWTAPRLQRVVSNGHAALSSRCQFSTPYTSCINGSTSHRRDISSTRTHHTNVRRKAAASAAPAGRPASGTFHHGTFYLDMDVRDYELDQYGVVNNGIYAHYFQHARHEALELLGCSPDEFARDGTPLALSELNIQYKAPLRSQDKFYVAVYVSKVTPARVVVQHSIVKTAARRQELEQPQEVASATGTIVFLDSQYKPQKVPAPLKEVFIGVQQQREQQ